jgi:PAS domain-containing protein/DNA-binding CsgD family transcriptional regulator
MEKENEFVKLPMKEETLQETLSLLNATGRMAKVGGWEFDVETLKQLWTEEVYHIHEIDLNHEPDVKKGLSFYSPESKPIIESAVQRVISHGEPFDLELQFITAKGNHRWVHAIGEAQRKNRKTKKVFGTFQDVTERKHMEIELINLRNHLEDLVNERTTELEKEITNHIQTEEALKGSEFFFSQMFEQSTTSTCLYNPEGTILKVNSAFCKMFGVESEIVTDGRYNVFKDKAAINSQIVPLLLEIFNNKKSKNWELDFNIDVAANSTKTPSSKRGQIFIEVFGYPIKDTSNKLKFVVLQHYDITERKQLQKELNKSFEELELKIKQRTTELTETNTALKILLRNNEEIKIELEEKILSNVKGLIFPFIKKLHNSRLSNEQNLLLDIITSNIDNIISPFSRILTTKYSNLTPKEIQIANLIKEGRTSKEIAQIIASNTNMVQFHRKNLRKKLGLRNKNINLKTHLLSLP